MMFKERIKFYADTPKEKNKYFCFEIVSILEFKAALWRFFDKGWNIRALWYEKINKETNEVLENIQLNVFEHLQEYIDTRSKEQRKKIRSKQQKNSY